MQSFCDFVILCVFRIVFWGFKSLSEFLGWKGCQIKSEVDKNHDVYKDHSDPEELCRCIPVLVHGDEGVGHRRKPVLHVCWGPLLRVGVGATDRLFLITTCPHKFYSGYNDGTAAGNPVIDRFMKECGRSLTKCYYQGIPVGNQRFYLVCLGLAGDHPFQTKVCGSLRAHLCKSICPHCHANTSTIPFEDCSENAAWRCTTFQSVPWVSTSKHPFFSIPRGAHPCFVRFDLMHMVPHGVGRNFCASIVCMMAGPLDLFSPFPGNGLRKDRCLEAAYRLFDSWLRCTGNTMRDLKEFTPENLQWKLNRDFPDSNCKASDCTVLTKWLIDLIGTMPWERSTALDLAYQGLVGLDEFQRLCYSGLSGIERLFMDRARQIAARNALQQFLVSYSKLAKYWYERRWCLFGFTPKYHYTCHWEQEISEAIASNQVWVWNPAAFATPMMEDFVGVCSRMSRTTHPSTVPLNTIRKYLVEMKRLWH